MYFGPATVPIRLRNVVKVTEIYVFPNLRQSLVLGIDIWCRMGMVFDVRKVEWYFSDVDLSEPMLKSIY